MRETNSKVYAYYLVRLRGDHFRQTHLWITRFEQQLSSSLWGFRLRCGVQSLGRWILEILEALVRGVSQNFSGVLASGGLSLQCTRSRPKFHVSRCVACKHCQRSHPASTLLVPLLLEAQTLSRRAAENPEALPSLPEGEWLHVGFQEIIELGG